MELSTRVDRTVPFPPERAWEVLVSLDRLPDVLRPRFPIPGVERAEVEGGGELAVGRTRLVHLTDGTTARERILAHDPPGLHRYDLQGLAPPFGWIVSLGVAEWRLEGVDGGTRVEWTYTFTTTTPLAWPLARLALVPFRRFMRAGLEGIERVLRDRP